MTSQLGNVVLVGEEGVVGKQVIILSVCMTLTLLQLVPRMYGSFPKESHYQLAKITYYSAEVMDPDHRLPSLGGGIQSSSIRRRVR